MKKPPDFSHRDLVKQLKNQALKLTVNSLFKLDGLFLMLEGFNSDAERKIYPDDLVPLYQLRLSLKLAEKQLTPATPRKRKSKKKDSGEDAPDA